MNQLTKLFEGHELTIIDDGEPMFLLNDLVKILGLSNSRMVKYRLDDDVISTYPIQDSIGRTQVATFVNEDGLYDVILDSRKSEAKPFRKWITSEVIPSIRKQGGYLTPEKVEEVLSDPDTIINLATQLKEERERRQTAERTVEIQRPKALFAEAVETSTNSVLIGELSKIIRQNGVDIGQNRLFNWMRDNGYLIRKRGESYNLPSQKSMDLGLFEIKKRTVNNPDGSIRTTRTPKVTGKGQVYFVNKFIS